MAMAEVPVDMRHRAGWMTATDDTVLELIEHHGNLTPGAIGDLSPEDGPTAHHAGIRSRKLVEAGLLEQITHGLYGLTDKGQAYLDGALDASTLPTPDDE